MTPMPTLAPVPTLATLTTLAVFPMLSVLAPLTLTITATERDAVRDLDVGHTPIFRTCRGK
jgi:hypothetical protein